MKILSTHSLTCLLIAALPTLATAGSGIGTTDPSNDLDIESSNTTKTGIDINNTEDVQVDQVNGDIDICFLPHLKGTRDASAKKSCFLCDWEKDRIYWTRPGSGIVFTNNVKPRSVAIASTPPKRSEPTGRLLQIEPSSNPLLIRAF